MIDLDIVTNLMNYLLMWSLVATMQMVFSIVIPYNDEVFAGINPNQALSIIWGDAIKILLQIKYYLVRGHGLLYSPQITPEDNIYELAWMLMFGCLPHHNLSDSRDIKVEQIRKGIEAHLRLLHSTKQIPDPTLLFLYAFYYNRYSELSIYSMTPHSGILASATPREVVQFLVTEYNEWKQYVHIEIFNLDEPLDLLSFRECYLASLLRFTVNHVETYEILTVTGNASSTYTPVARDRITQVLYQKYGSVPRNSDRKSIIMDDFETETQTMDVLYGRSGYLPMCAIGTSLTQWCNGQVRPGGAPLLEYVKSVYPESGAKRIVMRFGVLIILYLKFLLYSLGQVIGITVLGAKLWNPYDNSSASSVKEVLIINKKWLITTLILSGTCAASHIDIEWLGAVLINSLGWIGILKVRTDRSHLSMWLYDGDYKVYSVRPFRIEYCFEKHFKTIVTIEKNRQYQPSVATSWQTNWSSPNAVICVVRLRGYDHLLTTSADLAILSILSTPVLLLSMAVFNSNYMIGTSLDFLRLLT